MKWPITTSLNCQSRHGMPCHARYKISAACKCWLVAVMQALDAEQQLAALKAAAAAERAAKHSLEGQQSQLQGASSRLERQLAAAEAERESLSAQLKVCLCQGKSKSTSKCSCTWRAGCWWACSSLAAGPGASTFVHHMDADWKRGKAAQITTPPEVATNNASTVLPLMCCVSLVMEAQLSVCSCCRV